MSYTNRQFTGYRAVSRIGEGGISEVWKARGSKDCRKQVAIKIMLPKAQKDKKLKATFMREWSIVKNLDHPGILKYFFKGTINNLPYIVMEFFTGKPLRNLIAEKDTIIKSQPVEIISRIADCLHYLHGKGIVHRDLKPENILVNTKGEIRIIDLALAQNKWQRLLNLSKRIDGTPAYMAPEQLQRKSSSYPSDIYALGIIVYEMLTGKPPFTATSTREIINKHLKKAAPRLSKANPDISPAIDKLVANMLAKEPGQRPQGAAEITRQIKSSPLYLS